MNPFLHTFPAGSGPVSLPDIIRAVTEAQLKLTEQCIDMLSEWRDYETITPATHHEADKALMRQSDHLRSALIVCGNDTPAAIR